MATPYHPSLNLPDMDAQHDYLFSLFDLLGSPAQVSAINALAAEIERYIMYHCECEERLMRAYAFPGFSVHQSDHETMQGKLARFLDECEKDTLNPAALRVFLTGWLLEHSRMSDSEYAAWVRERRGNIMRGAPGSLVP